MRYAVIATLVIALIVGLSGAVGAQTMQELGFYHYPQGTLDYPFPYPAFEYVNGCDGWENWYMRPESGWAPGFYLIYGRGGGPSSGSPDVWIKGPVAPLAGYQQFTPFCSWVLSLPAVSWSGRWGVFRYPDGRLFTYHVDRGDFHDNGIPRAGTTFEAPYIWPRADGETVIDYAWQGSDRPIVRTSGDEWFAVDLASGERTQLAQAMTTAPPRAQTPWDPPLEAELEAYYATAALYESWTTYFKIEAQVGGGHFVTDQQFSELVRGNLFAFAAVRAHFAVTEQVMAEWPLSRGDVLNSYRASVAYTQALIAVKHMAQLHLVMRDMAYTNRLIIADWFPGEIQLPPFPAPQQLPPPETFPIPIPQPAPELVADPPAPQLTSQQVDALRTIATFVQYGHTRGWSDQVICTYMCPIIHTQGLDAVFRSPDYSVTVSTVLQGFAQAGIVQDYARMIDTLDLLLPQELPGKPVPPPIGRRQCIGTYCF